MDFSLVIMIFPCYAVIISYHAFLAKFLHSQQVCTVPTCQTFFNLVTQSKIVSMLSLCNGNYMMYTVQFAMFCRTWTMWRMWQRERLTRHSTLSKTHQANGSSKRAKRTKHVNIVVGQHNLWEVQVAITNSLITYTFPVLEFLYFLDSVLR